MIALHPTRAVHVKVSAAMAVGSATLVDASGTSTAQLDDPNGDDTANWTRDVAFGDSVEVDIMATTIYSNGGGGSLTCSISDEGATLAKGQVTTVGGVAVCKWVNNGQ